MNKLFSFLVFLIAFQFSAHSRAAEVTLQDVNTLLDFAEQADPELFAPPAQTQQTNEAGSDWYYRFYAGPQLFVAVNVNGTGPFFAGDVYVLGGPYGNQPTRVDSLANLLAYIDSLTPEPAVSLADANKLFDFAQIREPALFFPSMPTQQVNEQGSNWYVRQYPYTQVSIKINIDGTSPFLGGNVYVIGGPFGSTELFIDTLPNLLAYINSLPGGGIDDDIDGVNNLQDECPDTPNGESVDGFGCSNSQLDDDNDGVKNSIDQCPLTPAGEGVDDQGCGNSQLDDDNDGVNNDLDYCPDTPEGESVNDQGCSDTQLDDDNDGVNNATDQCPNTPNGQTVSAQGCSDSQVDGDSDGVNNALDQCPLTPSGETVDAQGCSNTQLDDDNDGVYNATDQCPNTPTGETVDAQGCSNTQLDDDNDGVYNATDQCPNTLNGQTVNAQGCSNTQLDDDNDGVNNAADECANTPTGESVNSEGCSESQLGGGPVQYIVDAGNGSCAPVVTPSVGTIARFRHTSKTDEGDITFEGTEEWLVVTLTEAKIRSTQVIVAPPVSTNTVSESTLYLDVMDGLIFTTGQFTKVTATTTISGLPIPLPPTITMSEITTYLDPMLFVSPQDFYCEGMILFHPSVNESTIVDPDPGNLNPIESQTPESTTTVLAVDEEVTVEAGTFTTVHLKSTEADGIVETWLDRESGIMVKNKVLETDETVIGTTELIELN